MIVDSACLAIAAVASLIEKVIDGQPQEFKTKQWERFERFLALFDPPPQPPSHGPDPEIGQKVAFAWERVMKSRPDFPVHQPRRKPRRRKK